MLTDFLNSFRWSSISCWRSTCVNDVISKLDYGQISDGPCSAWKFIKASCRAKKTHQRNAFHKYTYLYSVINVKFHNYFGALLKMRIWECKVLKIAGQKSMQSRKITKKHHHFRSDTWIRNRNLSFIHSTFLFNFLKISSQSFQNNLSCSSLSEIW